ncbi:MAG: TIGR02147 family protein [Bdellovibrionales bacterium]|nr:TIGR02147 family protein [Bdellovibrionales bacterium]
MLLDLNYRTILQTEFKRRQAKNSAYSLRAFARDLGLSSTHLSDILRAKSQLSTDRAATLVEKLDLKGNDSELFLDLVEIECAGTGPAKRLAENRLKTRFANVKVLKPEQLNLLSEWHYLPLMELLSTRLKDHSALTLGRRLGMSRVKIGEALEFLLNKGFITRNEDRYEVVANHTAAQDIPSATIRQHYRTVLEQAAEAIEDQELNQREFSVVTMALSKKKIALAKERIRHFRRQLAEELGADDDKDAVYTLSVCFFENTKDRQ